MKLEELGYNEVFEKLRIDNKLEDFEMGRVISEHKERYIVKTLAGEFEAEITGNLRFSARSREDFPAVGDWVALTKYEDDFAIIHKILPRLSSIKRQAVGRVGEIQMIATNRELIVLESGGILIDNPGMREVGIADTADGLETTFNKIVSLSRNCKFKDCTHTNEIGCSVLEALEKGTMDKSSYDNYLKMEKEKAYFQSTVEEKRKKDKEFGKIMKNYKKDMKKSKYFE